MRCGKVGHRASLAVGDAGRNPRECAVAKVNVVCEPALNQVATRANALWQRGTCRRYEAAVASQPARMR